MGTTGVYNRARYAIGTGQVKLDTDDLRVLLVSVGYTFNPKHLFTNITAELGGSGYVRKQLANKLVVQDDNANLVRFSADPLVWTGANFGTPDAAIIYKEGVTDVDRIALWSVDLQPKIATSGGNFTLNFNTLGIMLIQ